jgi:integrase
VRVNGILKRKSFASAAEARRWQRSQKELQDQIRSGAKRHLEPTLLTVHAADFLRSRKGQTSFGHQETWMGKYILARPEVQAKFLHELTKVDWKVVFGPTGELIVKHGLSPATHNRVRSMVHTMYEHARREYEPPRAIDNPIHDIDPLEEPKKKRQILETKEQIRDYIKAAYKDPVLPCWGPYVMTKLNTGLRQQNLIALRWKDWSGDTLLAREKYVRSKTVKGFRPGSKSDADERLVPVNPLLKDALEKWKKATPHAGPEDFIFATPDAPARRGGHRQRKVGSHVTDKQIWGANKRTCTAAGLPYLSEHKLRHSYASHFLAAGGSMRDLQQNLFHSTITTTEIYSHDVQASLAKRGAVLQIPAPGQKGKG